VEKKAEGSNTAEMPITGHLQEFRQRLIKSVFVLILAAGIAFYYSEVLLGWLRSPLSTDLVFLSPAEAFWADMKIAIFFGFLVAFPIILYEVWLFIAPGLLKNERGAIFPLFSFGVLLFYGGLTFCHFVALPFALDFLINYGRNAGIQPLISVSNYVDFNLKILLAFALIFELPLVMVVLAKMGLLTPDLLSKNRKYAVLGAFLIAAIATPTPDIFNQVVMAVPLIILYEVGIITVRLFGGRKRSTAQQKSERT